MKDEDLSEKVNLIIKQFLCNVPIQEVCWETIPNVNLEIQEQIIDNTVSSEQVLQYPISIKYQKKFLKHLLRYLEKQKSVVYDLLYEEYCRLVELPCNNVNFKHYSFEENSKNIILKEDIHLISDGTTGLHTWQASLALSEWILANTTHFNNKVILELGSGIGLTGIVTTLNCSPKTVYLTDCHYSVLTTLCENININIDDNSSLKGGNCSVGTRCLLEKSVNSSVVSVLNLPWEEVSPEFCKTLGKIDKIVAADVVYDRSIFEPLISALNCFFNYSNTDEFILSCTERNTDTLNDFLAILRKQYHIDIIETPQQKNFLWPSVPPVKIFSLTQFSSSN